MKETTTPYFRIADDKPHHVAATTSEAEPDEAGIDWAYLAELTPEENRANAASDPDAVILTDEQRRRLRPVPDPRAIRKQLGLTQHEFSRRFEVPLGTLRDWEQGRRFIDATARVLLRTIALAPDLVDQANHPEDLDQRTATRGDVPASFVHTLEQFSAMSFGGEPGREIARMNDLLSTFATMPRTEASDSPTLRSAIAEWRNMWDIIPAYVLSSLDQFDSSPSLSRSPEPEREPEAGADAFDPLEPDPSPRPRHSFGVTRRQG